MKKLLTSFAALVLAGSCASLCLAENYTIPFDRNGNIPSDINLIGADVFVDTGISAIGSTSPVVLYGYSVSSDAVTNFAMLRDSNTLNTTSNIKLTLYPDAYASSGAQTITAKLPVPVIFRNGLSINLNSAVNGVGAARGRWMFYVRYLNEGAVAGKAPTDVDPRIKVDNVGVN